MTEYTDVPKIAKAAPAEQSAERLNYPEIMQSSGAANLQGDTFQRAASLPSLFSKRDSYPYPSVQISENVFTNNNFPLKFTEADLRQEIQRSEKLKTEVARPIVRAPEVRETGDRTLAPAALALDTPSKTYEYQNLRNRSAAHSGPDAMLYVPKNFDSSKPINLVVYNHGFGSTARSSFRDSELGKQMANAPPNTVLIVPEWQAAAGSRGYNQGNLSKPGAFRSMVEEVFDKTPELRGKTMRDVSKIHIVSHSAGHAATETQIYQNGLSSKIASITMIDSTYAPQRMEPWIQSNIRELANGSKRFISISNDTNSQNNGQASRVEQMLRRGGLSTSSMLKDFKNSGLDERSLAQYPIIFKSSSVAHNSMPKTYFGAIEKASKRW
ncbi:MAG: hypothetical protein IAF58_12890 [Leptolyngbya sp.]|nr:hypothetical protein [Candidatus Melainabacteria bacterium]